MDKMTLANSEFFATVEDGIARGKNVTIIPKGNSMMPFIRSGKDSVILSPAGDEIAVGDIVLFKLGGRHILHRIIHVEGDRLTSMGDGNIRGREHFHRRDVVAVVTGIRRSGRLEFTPPGRGIIWRALLPFRRIILGVYRRVKPSDFASL
ncbi:MAG: S24/S26 family peptidase [Candidatus Cryptobacteroides sp.]